MTYLVLLEELEAVDAFSGAEPGAAPGATTLLPGGSAVGPEMEDGREDRIEQQELPMED
ncbi:MAG: hypothetical protein HUU14_00115 [Dehalococcoidia bacterium]|nr:hypothetical protein [Dehalococcoidia bacterium]NUQ54271.1 hypothetical protein [Dehalococcoidia bacterium]